MLKGWLELSASKSKNWLKKSVSKPWKKKFFVLRRDEDNTDRVLLLAYDKEENAAKQKPKKTLDLFPKYQVAKTNELKGKEFTFQVSNETESWFLAAKNQKVLDLWVIQIQMQTKLSRSISGQYFIACFAFERMPSIVNVPSGVLAHTQHKGGMASTKGTSVYIYVPPQW